MIRVKKESILPSPTDELIDEMQDYSRLQYLIIRRMFSCKMTILGDRAQTMADQQQDVMQVIPGIFGMDLRRIEMRKS